jgi:hypothetical protein
MQKKIETNMYLFFFIQQEYLNFMSRKANMRQNSIITLSDQCKKEIDDIKREKEALMRDYEARKKELHTEFLAKQTALNRIKAELEEMNQYKVYIFFNFKTTSIQEIFT